MREIASPLSGFGSPFGRRRVDDLSRVIRLLFGADEPGFLLTASPETCFTDLAGTTQAEPGDPVALWLDQSGNDNHAVQPTSANRPRLGRKPKGGRRNLLTFTEQFDNAAWTKEQGVTASGTTINFIGTAITPLGASPRFYQLVNVGERLGKTFTARLVIPAASQWSDPTAVLRIGFFGGPTAQNFTAQSEAQIYTVTFTSATPGANVGPTINADKNVTISGFSEFQFEEASAPSAYQKVTTRFDVTEAGKPDRHYLFFGGALDARWMQTPVITPGTDKVQVFAGVRKLSDAARQQYFGYGNPGSSNGSFDCGTPNANGEDNFGGGVRGSDTGRAYNTPGGFPAPLSAVATTEIVISDEFPASVRVNGAQQTPITYGGAHTPDTELGNFSARIGKRFGGTLFFNGEISALTARFGPNLDANQIELVERFTASKVAEPTI